MPRTKRRLEKSPQAWQHMVFFLTESEESSFSEEKEAKRLCVVGRAVVNQRAPTRAKVFCFFFSKKKNLAGIWQCGRA